MGGLDRTRRSDGSILLLEGRHFFVRDRRPPYPARRRPRTSHVRHLFPCLSPATGFAKRARAGLIRLLSIFCGCEYLK